ncbi:aminopeptidase N [Mariprofundus sp. NF]|uniref:aminopeptidase N n=1 Tax=Mariprofundus sp. NF TaxID=2608716 RepID=UPI0017F3C6BF|nr:aminopeptidase N [Mariprofundus sp. NF]NWF38087.1 aminopeptidase N [Mariprofundus sp. NF]
MTQPQTVYLKDYQAPPFLVDHVALDFTLHPSATEVVSRVKYRRNNLAATCLPLDLDGFGMQLITIRLDGLLLEPEVYLLSEQGLRLSDLPDIFELEITTRINPEANSALEGLYRSGGNYCTQCEAEGFRRITFYQDRPDVMAPFDVRIVADKQTNPVLLSNGNPTAAGELAGGLHWAEWSDPFAKPCYLFALVAGDLACVQDCYQTASGRDVALRIYTEAHHVDHCDHAMASLKRAMTWDEQRFGLEYDLDLFMIVAVDDFNMGAMENKGLNIFNSRLVFATPETATDDDYIAIEAVIGHEYFHNWTGNRVTCRDWFQLSLKEGLTVFRDQEFTADHHSHAVKRIEDVRLLRSHQFAEDASPMAHPIRPASYMEINNFYTVTVYEKGAEVVRLYQSLLGVDGFRRGMDLYFKRHDGQAVSTEDFLAAMGDANGRDLSQMQTWYDQAGTPRLSVRMEYNEQEQCCTMHCAQSSPATPEAIEKKPLLIPLTLGLLLPDGSPQPLQLEGESEPQGESRALLITEQSQSFTFIHVAKRPLPSLLRGFSAPVELDYPYSAEDDAFLMAHDSDAFNRWAAAQRLAMQSLLAMLAGHEPEASVATAFGHLLRDAGLDAALKAEALMLPSESDIAEASAPADPGRIHAVREQLLSFIASSLREDFEIYYHRLSPASGLDDHAMQQRQLKNVCLSYLVSLKDKPSIAMAYEQFCQAENMTDQYAALALLAHCDCDERLQALASFEKQWSEDANVMDKWFALQASSSLPDSLAAVKLLMTHPKFDLRNPNKVRAVIGSFAMRNPVNFHALDGSGYSFVADQVLALDRLNPQIASRMVRALMNWKRLEPKRSELMRSQLQRIADADGISGDVYEIVSKSLC